MFPKFWLRFQENTCVRVSFQEGSRPETNFNSCASFSRDSRIGKYILFQEKNNFVSFLFNSCSNIMTIIVLYEIEINMKQIHGVERNAVFLVVFSFFRSFSIISGIIKSVFRTLSNI